MRVRRVALMVVACAIGGAGCSQAMTSGADGPDRDLPPASTGTDEPDSDTGDVTTTSEATTSTLVDDATDDSTTPPSPTTTPPTTTPPTTTPVTTTTEPELDVFDAGCVVEVLPGDSLGAIVTARADELVTVASLQAENGLADEVIDAGQLLDVCIDNGLDDITGEQRLERNAAVVAAENFTAVANQQTRLNELLTPFGYPAMPVDGDSGPVTRRALCAARVALGMGVNRQDMEPGSLEEYVFFTTFTLANPQNVTTDGRWAFIDVTCQVMFIGEGPNLVYVFPTSTGEAEHKTRLQERARAFRYNPAASNGGWHNS